MQSAELSVPERTVIAVVIGLASFALLFSATFLLFAHTVSEMGRLSYRMLAFVVGCITSMAVSAFGTSVLRSYLTGSKRNEFISLATWVSILLPLISMAEFAVFPFLGYWWFAYAAQWLIAGVLGIVVAISRRGWWRLFGAWGAVLIGSGVLQATAPLWAN